jgi:threonine synthase
MTRFVSHLEAAIDGTRLPADRLSTVHKDRPIWVRYDLPAVRTAVTKEQLRSRPETMWRYRELLPLFDAVWQRGSPQLQSVWRYRHLLPHLDVDYISLGERMTPLLPCARPRLVQQLGLEQLWIKDESQLPTGSFKARGMAMAISMARHFGITRVALPTAGNAGGAAAAYAARAGLECFVFMPQDTPVVNQYECRIAGAKTFLVNGLIGDCGRIVREGREELGWFDLSTLKEPYRLEGKKTMGLELAEQFDWQLPDVILYPTGGGTGLIGMWKAFAELRALGWLESDKLPRMVCVQSDGCAPIVRAFESGARFAEPFLSPRTIASGLRVPSAVGDFMILDAIRESGGTAIAVEESRLIEWLRLATSLEGIPICPEAAACVGALESLVARGWIKPDERVVLFNTGAAQKYVEAITAELPRLDITQPLDWKRIEDGS